MTNESVLMEESLSSLGDYSLQYNRWLLKPIGAWPLSLSSSRLERIVSLVLIVLCYGFILFTVIPCMFHIVLEDENIHMKLKVLGPLSHWFFGGVNYTTLLLRGKDIRDCVEHIKTDWKIITRQRDQHVMLKKAKLGRFVAVCCAAFMQGGVLCYCAVSAFTMMTIEVGNETKIIRMLPCAAYKSMIAVDTSPTNEIVLASQFVSGFIVNSSAVGAFGLAIVFAAHAYAQLSIVMMWITEFVNEWRDRKKNGCLNEIGVIVEHHLRVLTFIGRIESVMSRICFMELFKSTLDICMLGYYILTEWADHDVRNLTTYFMILISMSFNIFTVCYIGEVLMEQCKRVGEVTYMTNWYYLPEKRILELSLIIVRSSLTTKITAGKIIDMSIYTFGQVAKTSVAYINLLRQVT
ncbi:unnamed protein product [Xylocopa violacea]|uniref:Odorant receptor n=1 Tax=Xylocopa violacea TaxID=135666 RepID=A0ABP1NAR4_XYLVO